MAFRYLYSFSRSQLLPKALQKTNKAQSPFIACFVNMVLGLGISFIMAVAGLDPYSQIGAICSAIAIVGECQPGKKPLLVLHGGPGATHFITIASAETVDEACSIAVHDMLDILRERTGVAPDQLTMLMSLASDVRICQIVDPEKTVRFEMPKYVIEAL